MSAAPAQSVQDAQSVQNAQSVLSLLLERLDAELRATDALLAARYGGGGSALTPAGRLPQPVHTVYVPADRADAATPAAWGRAALDLLAAHAGDPAALATATHLPVTAVAGAWPRLQRLLAEHPVADLRLDLEDGYGSRPDDVEDADARRAGATLASLAPRTAGGPALAGVRIRSLEASTRRRALRTLDLVVGALAGACAGRATPPVVVTLAKVSAPAQVAALATALDALEAAHGLAPGAVGIEVQVEVPALVVGADGAAAVARCLDAAAGRCTALHYGTYDFSAACGVPPAWQSLEHPLADHAKAVLQLAAAGTGVFVADGSTNVVPTGPREQVHVAWALHARLVGRALERGLPQGWDLHPGHLVTRHLANLVFYDAAVGDARERLAAWAASRPAPGAVLDEPATAQAMAALLVRAAAAGAADLADLADGAGMGVADLQALAARRVL